MRFCILKDGLTVFCITRAQREVKYEELTLAEFVAGYAQILLCKDITPLERTESEKHLVSLMYFAQQYEWSAVTELLQHENPHRGFFGSLLEALVAKDANIDLIKCSKI